VDQLIKSAYHLLGLMSFLTAGEKEVRAWTIPQGHARADRRRHDSFRHRARLHPRRDRQLRRSDAAGSYATAREKGLLRLEGKDYIMQEGDVVHFRFQCLMNEPPVPIASFSVSALAKTINEST
jgi:ribosome-binding ATPase YchF (GTP1/OBG family)